MISNNEDHRYELWVKWLQPHTWLLTGFSIFSGPSTQTDVEISAEGLNDQEVEFPAGGSRIEFIDITFRINDDDIGLEAIEMYVASFEIISAMGIVEPVAPETTVINILDDDSKQH